MLRLLPVKPIFGWIQPVFGGIVTIMFWWNPTSHLLSLARAGEPLLHVFGPPSLA